jgi:2-polyprenyl-3-methyl-5-hydroxy-6-metoxy-1,4-benzoquinol methylase
MPGNGHKPKSSVALVELTVADQPRTPQPRRLQKVDGLDYKRAAIEYPHMLDDERHYYLLTKPFYNLANKPPKHTGDGLDAETYRHFCDFANLASALALPPGSRLLDVGCGSGWLSEYLARLGYQVTGIDISPDLIALSRERLSRVPYHADHQTPLAYRFLTHDIESAPVGEQFDGVVCYDSLHHFVDEHAVMRHLSAAVKRGGLLFIMEGDNPPTESPTAQELRDVMREYGTLESPFSPEYLRSLLVAHGFAVIGDYVSLNGLFERDVVAQGQVQVASPEINYLLCKKVTDEGSAEGMPDSRHPGVLSASITLTETWSEWAEPGTSVSLALRIENTGDTLWLNGDGARRGAVMPAVKILDRTGALLDERHGEPPLSRVLAPGESVPHRIEIAAPSTAGEYQVRIDLVAQHVAWFEEHGSRPLILPLRVAER